MNGDLIDDKIKSMVEKNDLILKKVFVKFYQV
jgi:hypothetical protein